MKSEIKVIDTEPDEEGNIWFTFPPTAYNFSTNNAIDLSYLNSDLRSRIIIKDGHFYDECTKRRIRFFGTNVVGADAFPSKEDSPLLAKRMSQIGINIVRFHHMDHHDIWLDDTNHILSPKKLDLLHYFLYSLHRNGIYANINLHVTREYPDREYSRSTPEFKQIFRFGKSLDRFYQPFINEQIQFAINLLNSYNVYTKCKLGNDPMILNIELNNENSMVDLTNINKINAIRNTLFELDLKKQWSCFLKKKYGCFEKVKFEWNPENELIDRNIDLLNGLKHGYQKDKNTVLNIQNGDGCPIFEFSIDQIPMYFWSNQIHFYDFPLEINSIYTIEFEAKAIQKSDENENLTATVMFEENKPPYKVYSIKSQVVKLTEEFQKFSVTLTSSSNLETENKESTMICKIILCQKLGVFTFKNIKAFKGKEITRFWEKSPKKSMEITQFSFDDDDDANGELLKYLKHGFQKDPNTNLNIDEFSNDDYPTYEFSVNQIPTYTWSNQVHFYSFPLENDTTYTIEFEAKAVHELNEKYSASVLFQENRQPYKVYSVKNQSVILTDNFQKFSVNVTSKTSLETEDKDSTMVCKIVLCPKVGVFTFKNMKAYKGIKEQKQDKTDQEEEKNSQNKNEQESLNDSLNDVEQAEPDFDDILLPDVVNFPVQANRDFRLFIHETETNTQVKLMNFIKDSFPNSRILIVDSQAVYGNMMSFEREVEHSDLVDNHSYWQHPIFDKGFMWYRDHYSIKNTPMFDSNDFGTFNNLTMFKPFKKPYTISEYNHSFPNEHLHEKFPMLGSWAAFHDWDAIYQFAYGQVSKDTKSLTGYFNMASNPIDFALAPFLVFAFRKFYISTSKNHVHLKIPKSFIRNQNEKGQIKSQEVIKPYHPGWPSIFDVEIIDDLNSQKLNDIEIDTNINVNERGKFITDEIIWNDTYHVNAPKLKTITGFIGDSKKSIENDLGILKIKIKLNEKLNESATVGIVSLDDKDLVDSQKILLVVAGKTKNTDQKWNKERTSTGRVSEGCNWGTSPILVQFIEFEASLFLPENEKLTIWTINEFGEKNKILHSDEFEIKEGKKRWIFKSDFCNPSLSFLIERNQ